MHLSLPTQAQAQLHESIQDELAAYTVKVIGADDHQSQDLSIFFEEMAAFIAEVSPCITPQCTLYMRACPCTLAFVSNL